MKHWVQTGVCGATECYRNKSQSRPKGRPPGPAHLYSGIAYPTNFRSSTRRAFSSLQLPETQAKSYRMRNYLSKRSRNDVDVAQMLISFYFYKIAVLKSTFQRHRHRFEIFFDKSFQAGNLFLITKDDVRRHYSRVARLVTTNKSFAIQTKSFLLQAKLLL